jgi:CBS domain-containing protein
MRTKEPSRDTDRAVLAPPRRAVRDLMTADVVSMSPGDTLADLADRMADENIRHMPIVDRDGDLVGFVTDRELAELVRGVPLSLQRDLLGSRRVREIMPTEIDTVEPDQSLREAAQMLLENKVGGLPVVEGSHLVGILTESDFVRLYVESA